jgi:carbon monoxide dehydrogenase subunit G
VKVTLAKRFPLPVSADQAWSLLQDVERVAACMPGARITERVDERHYKGTVAVRFGPANMSFRGEIAVATIEASARTLRLIGKGTDSTGGSGASLDLTARVEAENDTSCTLVGSSEVSLSGKVAAFGGRMAESVAEQVLKQFAANFAAALQTPQSSAAATASTAATPAAAAAHPFPAASPSAGGASHTAAATPTRQTQLNGLALLWGVLVSWVRSLLHLRGA